MHTVHNIPLPNHRREIQLELHGVSAPLPWQAVLLSLGEFPLKPPRYGVIRHFFDLLADVLTGDHGMQQEVLLQMWKLAPATGAELVSKHGSLWQPELGLGVWPDREPPRSW